MEEILAKLPGWVSDVPHYFTAAVLLATVLVRLTPSPKDDEVVSRVKGIWLGTLQRFPTLGTNPETKRMKKALEDLKGDKD